jgi:hypothetical protein
MAIQLPKYQKQVGVSGATTEQLIDPDVAAAPLRAATKAIGAVTDMGMEFASKLRQHKDEGDITGYRNKLELFGADLDVKKKAYKAAGGKDEEMMEKLIIPEMDKFNKDLNDSGYSKRVMDTVNADWGTQVAKIEASVQGEIIENVITKANLEKVNLALESLYNTAKPEQVERWKDEVNRTSIQAEKDRQRKMDEQRSLILTSDVMTNPTDTLSRIDQQLKGEQSYYDVDEGKLKSARAYAKTIISERNSEVIDGIYKSDSDYQKMNPNQKVNWLQDQFDDGYITRSAFNAEKKRVEEPSLMDVTPQDNVDFVNFQRELYGAIGDAGKQAEILNKVTSSTMPEEMRKQLYSMQRDLISPDSKESKAILGYGLETLDAVFGRTDIIEKEPWFASIPGISPVVDVETREDLFYRAQAEGRSEFIQWMLATPDVTIAQATQKVYDIASEKSKEYSLSQLPTRIEEQVVPMETQPTVEVQPTVEIEEEIPEFATEEEAEAAVEPGTIVIINGRRARID